MPMPMGPILPYTGIPVAGNTGTSSSLDPNVQQVLDLLKQLDQQAPIAPPAPPPPLSLPRRTIGSLGDAISAMAAVRAGGQPPAIGTFNASTQRQQQDYIKRLTDFQNQQQESANEERRLRATVGSQALLESQKAKSAFEVAKLKADAQGAKPLKSTVSTIQGADGKTVRVRDTFDPVTGEHLGREVLGEPPPPPEGFTTQFDENGNLYYIPKSPIVRPSAPTRTIGTSGSNVGPQAGQTPSPGGVVQVMGPGGKPFKKTPAANLEGIQQQLDNSEYLLNEMRSNWLQRPEGGIRQGVGTALANTLATGTGAKMGLSGVASAFDKHAVIHERDRTAIATALTFPFTGSRRALSTATQSLENIIPHYTDPPDVWNTFDEQVRQVIANARKMPWGENPEQNAQLYQPLFNSFLTNVAAAKGQPVTQDPKEAAKQLLEQYKKEYAPAK